MGKVSLKISPSLAGILNAQGSDWLTVEEEMREGATIGDLLTVLALSYTAFRKVIFNPDIKKISNQVLVVLNDSLVPSVDVIETKLNDGDMVTLLPDYYGG